MKRNPNPAKNAKKAKPMTVWVVIQNHNDAAVEVYNENDRKRALSCAKSYRSEVCKCRVVKFVEAR